MPTYEYRCGKCGEVFARFESMDDHAKGRPPCPECESKKVEQVFRSVSVSTSKKS